MNILLRIIHSSMFKSFFTLVLLLLVLNATLGIKKKSKGYLSKKKVVHSTFYVEGPNPLNNQKDIPLWASFYSPSIFIRDNSPMNYRYNLLAINPIRKFADDPNGIYKLATPNLAEQDFMQRHFSLAQVLYDNYQPFPIGNKKLPEVKIIRQPGAYFMTESGVVVAELPNFQKLEIVSKVQTTILKVSQLDTKRPIVSLTQSSTSQELDQMALSTLKQALLKTQTRKAVFDVIKSSQGNLKIDWRMN